MAANNDSADLEALFDSIAADFPPPAASAPAPAPSAPVTASSDGDSDDLQALFDSVAAETQAAPPVQEVAPAAQEPSEAAGDWPRQEAVFNRLGHMARTLHDTRSEEHTSELQSHHDLVCRLLLE